MGIIRKGILGGFSKKTGPLVGAIYRNQNVIKTVPVKSSKAPTQPQLNQRMKFGMVSSFLYQISELINTGFASGKVDPGPMQKAIAANLKFAIEGDAPEISLNLKRIRFSNGKLALPDHAAIEALPGCKVEFSWVDEGPEDENRAPGDSCTLLVYNPLKGNFTYQINASTRVEKFYVLQLPEDHAGDTVYCYLSFNSVKSWRLVSQSLYVGKTLVFGRYSGTGTYPNIINRSKTFGN